MAININALKQKVKKAIDRLPDVVDVYRTGMGKFKEPAEPEFVVQITGQYYNKGSSFVVLSTDTSGSTKSRQQEKFMVVIDEESMKVKEGDYFTLKGIKYKITDLGNTMDVYFDFSLERV